MTTEPNRSLVSALEQIGKKPGMWFSGDPFSLRLVETFITGYRHGVAEPDLSFDYFSRWVAIQYQVSDGAMNGFSLIREHVGNNDKQAFHEFFRLLPMYIKDMTDPVPDAIHAQYLKFMDEIYPK